MKTLPPILLNALRPSVLHAAAGIFFEPVRDDRRTLECQPVGAGARRFTPSNG